MKDDTTIELKNSKSETILGPAPIDDVRAGLRKLREVPMDQFNASRAGGRSDSANPKSAIQNPKSNEMAPIPDDGQFTSEFMADEWLQERGRDLVRDKFDDPLGQFDIRFLWKQGGGRRNGKAVLGKTTLPRSYARFYSKADALVWVAADWLRELKASYRFLEAVLFHELCHLVYGAWRADLKDLNDNLKQLKLL